jgi:hypothetical protein
MRTAGGARERGPHRLDAGSAHHVASGRAFGQVLEQRGLADTGLPAHDQDAGAPRPHALEQPVDRLLLISTPEQNPPGFRGDGRRLRHENRRRAGGHLGHPNQRLHSSRPRNRLEVEGTERLAAGRADQWASEISPQCSWIS